METMQVLRERSQGWDEAIAEVRRQIRGIPHWIDPDGHGEFDLQPLGPDETSEQGAWEEVQLAVDYAAGENPYD